MSAAPPASLELRGVSAAVAQQEVLHGIDIRVPPGELFVVVGTPGSGKSTLLRLVAGLEHLANGEIWLDDRNIGRTPAQRRGVALLLQTCALWPNLTVAENVAFALRGRRLSRAAIRETCARELAFVGLGDFYRHLPTQLSAAQQQRVALARTLATGVRLCLLDEPFGAQPPSLRTALARLLRRRQQRDGFTSLLATDDSDLGMRIADRIAVLHNGEVHQVGTPVELYDAPSTRQVATLTGAVNLIDGEVELHGERAVFRGENGLSIPLYDTAARRARRCTAMFRPGALRLVDAASAPVRNEIRLRGQVEHVAFLGEGLRCEVDLSGHPVWFDVHRADLSRVIDIGDNVDLGLDPLRARMLEQ